MSEHTPTPWQKFRVMADWGFPHVIVIHSGDKCESQDDVVAQLEGGKVLCVYNAVNADRIERCDANADFIVRACNSHDKLLEVARKLVRVWDYSGLLKSLNEFRLQEAINMAHAAISEAEGEQK